MPMSQQHELDDYNAPRVHITYDVETLGAVVVKELPFVMGVLGDFSGQPTVPLRSLEDRSFTEISRDNFDEVLGKLNAALDLRVKNTLTGEGEMSVHLEFGSIQDFSPEQVVEQVAPLKQLLDARDQLKALKNQVAKSADLERQLNAILGDADKFAALSQEMGSGAEKNPEAV
jgi:type VI secretion system protein ImpB